MAHGTTQGCRKGRQIQGKKQLNSQLQKPRAAGWNEQTTLLAFFRPDVTGMTLAVATSLALAVLFGHGSVAALGNSLQLEEIPVSER